MANKDEIQLTRRGLLKSAAMLGASFGVGASVGVNAAEPTENGNAHSSVAGMRFAATQSVRIGFVGLGGRGTSLLKDLLAVEGVKILALCDIVQEKAERARELVEKAGQRAPALYFKNDHDFENLCRREDLDIVYVATPWNWHVPMAVAAMNQGKHVAVEVPAATSVKECWELVDSSEKNRRHCVMLENCCYGYTELLILGVVQAGLLGDLIHGEAAYIHDLRKLLFSTEGEGLWRRYPHIKRNGNLYPTHGLGPVANYMNINRGDRFATLVSMSSKSVALAEYRRTHIPQQDAKWKEEYRCGDMNTSLIKTAQGRTIMLQHSVTSPRPYDRINLISGTKGVFRDYPPRIYFDGKEGEEEWSTLDKLKNEFEHPIWKKSGEVARKMGGHGGMDFIMNYRLMQCMREGLAPDMDVYDAASWSAPGPLSELSVSKDSAAVDFPDFSHGRWQEARPRQQS